MHLPIYLLLGLFYRDSKYDNNYSIPKNMMKLWLESS